MSKDTSKAAGKLVKAGKAKAKKAYDTVETKAMAAVGRQAVKNKVKSVKTVAARAGKEALIAGGLAAAGVVLVAITKRRKRA